MDTPMNQQSILDSMNASDRKWAKDATWAGHLTNVPGRYRNRDHTWDRVCYLTKAKPGREGGKSGRWVFVSRKKGGTNRSSRPFTVRMGTYAEVKKAGWCDPARLPVA